MAKEKAKGGPQPYGLYENAIRAERARYNALLEAHTPPGENHEEGC